MGQFLVREANPAVQETIRVAIQRLSKGGKRSVTKKHILKVLFLARERLSDNNHVKQDLAYYWYRDGPYSEVIYANLDHMVANGLVMKRKTDKSETYQLAPGQALRPVASDADLEVARHEIGLMASVNTDVHTATKRAYEAAPSRWYDTYNLKFKPQFESHCKAVSTGRESMYGAHDILERLDDAVLDYPTGPNFMEHRVVFMDFAKMLNAFLRWDSYHTRKDMVDTLHDMCDGIWSVFAYGARIRFHDTYYDDRIDAWEDQYRRELAELDHMVRRRLKEFDGVVTDDVEMDRDVMDMVSHPEKYKFTPLVSSTVVGNG